MVAVAGGGGLGMGESLATFTVDMVTLVGVLLGAAGVCECVSVHVCACVSILLA